MSTSGFSFEPSRPQILFQRSAMAIGFDEFKCAFWFPCYPGLPLTAKGCSADSSLALFLVAATVTLLRLIVFRFMRQKNLWWDDFFAFLSLLCLATFVPGEYLQ